MKLDVLLGCRALTADFMGGWCGCTSVDGSALSQFAAAAVALRAWRKPWRRR